MNDGLTDHVHLLLQYILNFVSQLRDYIPRLEFTRITQKISDEVTEVRSGLAEKFVMVFRKLTSLKRRIEHLETSGGSDSRATNEVHELKEKVRDLTVEIGNLRERNMSLERKEKEKMTIIDRLRSRMDQSDKSHVQNTVINERLQSRMDHINESLHQTMDKMTYIESEIASRAQKTIHSYNGTLLWKIEGYKRKRQDAINGVKTVLYSDPFYSAQYGYKMCAKIYMNGDGIGKGSHLSLFFVVMRGDSDALQTWPLHKKITMMLLDQGNGDHMIDTFHSDPKSSSFQRPKSDMNIASGSPLFMPLDSLNSRQYIKDDVMFVKIIVD